MISSLDYAGSEKEITVHSDEGSGGRVYANISSARINHYADVASFITQTAVNKFVNKHKRSPSAEELKTFELDTVRHIHFYKDLDGANKLEIQPIQILLG